MGNSFRSLHADALRDERLIVASKAGTLLAFRSAMEADDEWRRTRSARGTIEPSTQSEAVVRLERHQLGPNQFREIDAVMRCPRHLSQAGAVNLEHPDVRQGGGAGDRHREPFTVFGEREPADDLTRQLRSRRLPSRREIDERELVAAGDIP